MSDGENTLEAQNERIAKALELLAKVERHKLAELKSLGDAVRDMALALSNISTALAILLPPLKSVDPEEQRRAKASADQIRAGWTGY
jgi:hypothetical protein